MPVREVSFRVDYDYPFIALSKMFPNILFRVWCLRNKLLLAIPTEDDVLAWRIAGSIDGEGLHHGPANHSQGGVVFEFECECEGEDSIWTAIERYGFFNQPPVVFQAGWAYFRTIEFAQSDIRSLFHYLNEKGRAELLGLREVSLDMLPGNLWLGSLLPRLTGKQKDVVLKAHQCGYYASPRNVTADSVARSMGISRSTFEAHLRKAENAIMDTIVPYLKIIMMAPKNKRSDGVVAAVC